jgi:hypothetical protein
MPQASATLNLHSNGRLNPICPSWISFANDHGTGKLFFTVVMRNVAKAPQLKTLSFIGFPLRAQKWLAPR